MNFSTLHPWDVTASEAFTLQSQLASSLDVTRPLGDWDLLASADVSFERFSTVLHAAVIVMKRTTFEVVERVGVSVPGTFPYIPGLLSFREIPALLEAFAKIEAVPDVVMCDGQGTAHPRRLGIASHLGLWLQIPTIGCAKSRLCGEFQEPGERRGDRSPLMHRGELVGEVLRTRDRVSPLFISPGHLCDMNSSVDVVLETSGKYRLPVPARMAHEFVNDVRRAAKDH